MSEKCYNSPDTTNAIEISNRRQSHHTRHPRRLAGADAGLNRERACEIRSFLAKMAINACCIMSSARGASMAAQWKRGDVSSIFINQAGIIGDVETLPDRAAVGAALNQRLGIIVANKNVRNR